MTMRVIFSLFSLLATAVLIGSTPVLAHHRPSTLVSPDEGTSSDSTDNSSSSNSSTTTTTKPTTARAQAKSARTDLKTDLEAAKTALKTAREAKTGQTKERTLQALKDYGAKAIDVRIKLLDEFSTKYQDAKCSAEDKTTISTSLNTLKTTLTTKKTELAAATTPEAARTIIKAAISDTHVFGVWVPATRGLCATTRLITLIDGKITTLVNKLENAGLTVTEIEADMAAAKTKLQTAHDLYEGLVNKPSDTEARTKFTSAKTAVKEAKTLLTEVKTGIAGLRDDYNKATNTSTDDSPTTTTTE